MPCPNTNCVGNAVVAIGGFTFTETDWLDNGNVVERGATSVPNRTIQRKANGDISRLAQPNYKLQEIVITTSKCSDVYEALWAAHINGEDCYETMVINDPCCRPYTLKDVIITSMDPPDITYDETNGTITVEGVPTS